MSDRKWFGFRRRLSDNGDIEKPALKSANDNPWYCLATLYGEQPVGRLDQELAEQNRIAWEQWISGNMNDERRDELVAIFAQRSSPGSLTIPERATAVDFSHTHFERPVSFADFRFISPADFRSATFGGDANFGGALFNSNKVDFSSATFSGDTKFGRAQFVMGVDFESATFSGGVDFEYVHFGDPNFRAATFSGIANFRHALFTGISSTIFHSAVFSGDADFSSAVFQRGADFGSATFSKTASFNAAEFNIARFNAATFSNSITFINAEFKGSASFVDARFEALGPDFRGARMHEATEWHGVTWPKPPKSWENAQEQVYIYERLKQEMERLKKHEDEQKIFRMELRARRRLLRASPTEWLLNLIYQWSSDYGNSFIRPLLWLVVVFAVGAAIFARAPLYCGAPMPTKLAAQLSFANIFVFLPDKREIMMNAKMVQCFSSRTQAVSAAQSLLSVMLLFLLGLVLRNRFRMR
jgi:uncharacterized protein YjbI with pentapeptide repeats